MDVDSGLNRRDFLKYAAATGVLVAAGEALSNGAMAEAAAGFTEVDQLTIWILADNYFDSNEPDTKITKRYRSVAGKSIHAQHGLSYYIETVTAGKASACMFDFGLDSSDVMGNIELLGLDIGKTNAFSLSHGHYDHYTGAISILKQNQSRIAAGTPFYVGEEAFARRYTMRPGATEPTDMGQLSKEDIEALGVKVVEVKTSKEIIPGAYVTGNIERVTSYEKVPASFQIKRGEKIESDTFPGEQALFFNVKGKGLVVLSGCAHCGIVNTIKQAQKSAGTDRIHAVMGGFHMINAKPELIQSTVADIKAMKPDHIVGTHCTGFRAMVALSKEMPNEFIVNTAGTKYTFGAQA
ncbi:MAG: twin-arginine translocation signal domain-containing protein [Nitrospirae bacterium]|nr:twin-arginine translocation signal domain-containing protein [Nitrospirota bacterium]